MSGHNPEGGKPEAVRIRLLGGFQVSVGRRTIQDRAWRLRKAAAVVKLLALAPGHRLHRERVIDLLWPELGMSAASNNLRRAVHVARHVLEPDQAVAFQYLGGHDEQLVLCPEAQCWVDVQAFEAIASAARRADDLVVYRSAIELYAGDLLPGDRYEEWAEDRRRELRQLYTALLIELAELCEERGDFRTAIEALQKVLTTEPTHEGAHVALMRLYAFTGQRHQALSQYERLERTLRRELGTQPDEASRHLHREIVIGRSPRLLSSVAAGSAANSMEASSHNLPHALNSFIGREGELLAIKRALAMTRLLTLTGAAGCGKTRLVLEVARDLIEVYPGGVWLVDLAPLSESALVPQAVATVLGVSEQLNRSLIDTLEDALRTRNTLLVFDNCEHLVDACAHLMERLLSSCPMLRIMATSREATGVTGEVNWVVYPLSIPSPGRPTSLDDLAVSEAVRLFSERATHRLPDFVLTSENAWGVAEICRRLDGIPLALELAAARLGMLSVEQIATRLGDSLSLLASGRRTAALARQQTLRGTLEWSHSLLDRQEQRLFSRLSVFAGSWALEAAEAICSGNGLEEGSILDLLSRLVDKSLAFVEAGGSEVRYRLLEPIRQYAQERLTALGAAGKMQRRHAEYYLAQVREAEPELTGQRQVLWLERLELEHDNLRAALGVSMERRWDLGLWLSAALWRFWYMRGYLSEGQRWLEEGLVRSDVVPSEVRVKALDGAGWILQAQGDYSRAEALYEEQLTLSRELEDEGAIARSMGNLGSVAISQGYQERAAVFLEGSLASLRKLGRKKDIVSVLTDLGTLASAQGELARAIALFEEALALSREVGDVFGVAVSMGNLGLTALARGDHRLATPLLEESLRLFREVGDKQDIAIAVVYLGFTALSQGDHERATELLCEGLSLSRGLDEKPSIAKSLEGLAATAGAMGQGDRAARFWGAAQALREEIKAPLPSHEKSLHEPYVAAARLQLGEERWQAAWEEGRTMTPDEAAEYALTNTEIVSFASSPLETPQHAKDPSPLTRREWDVATLVAQGLSNREVAARLTISEQTAATHVKRILRKLNLDSRARLAVWIIEQGLPPTDLR